MGVPIVGRGDELAQLRAALVGASGGAGRLILISGEPGIGKTRLTASLADMASDYEVPAAVGCAIDDPGMPPLWPWHEVGRSVSSLAGPLTGGASPGGTSPGEPAAVADAESARFAMLAAACRALAAAAAERGLLVVLEDLQWADRTSLLLLRHLAAELPRSRLLVVATFRESAGEPLASLLPALLRADTARLIRLTGLSQPDIAQWLRQLGHSGDIDELATRLLTRTGGNPLFVRMLVERGATAADDGLRDFPELRQLLLAHLDGLDNSARELLGAASVLGERIDPQVLTEVTGLAAAEVGTTLDRAVTLRVLAAGPDVAGLSFAHALVRDAVYDELPPSRRMALHEHAARALERSGRGAACAGQIATHWERSGQPGWAAQSIRWAREAAQSATASLAYDEAAHFAAVALRAAAADTAQPVALHAELTLEAARAEFVAGHIEASLTHCQAAARLAQEAGRPDVLAAAALVITGMGDPATTVAVEMLCAAALDAVPASDTALRARLRARQAIFAAETGAGIRARELSAEALALAEDSDDPDALLDGLHARHLALSAPQFLAERRTLADRACQVARRARQPLAELWGHVWLVDAAFQAGDLAAVDEELGRIEQFAASRKHGLAWWHLHRLRATRAALIGDLSAAIEHNEAARAVAEQIGAFSTIGMYYAFTTQLMLLRGTIDRADGQATLAILRQMPNLPLVRVFVPLLHTLLGDRDLARATFEEFRYMPETVEVGPRWAALLIFIGIGAVLLDDPDTADRVYQQVSGLAPTYMGDGSGVVFCAGSLQRNIGDLALATGRVAEAIRRYTDAIEMNARVGARPFLALSRLGLAKAMVARDNPGDLGAARPLATEAAAEFRRLDLPGPLATADTLLARIDAQARAASPLSPRECEVAALIALAMSNRQIAERLVLSERTVETHVRSILAKLGYSTRTEIATWSLRQATTR
jgi:DNA-binding CsgD family transcriptional regulator/tetratricopeptide (TPR) repeat protein